MLIVLGFEKIVGGPVGIILSCIPVA